MTEAFDCYWEYASYSEAYLEAQIYFATPAEQWFSPDDMRVDSFLRAATKGYTSRWGFEFRYRFHPAWWDVYEEQVIPVLRENLKARKETKDGHAIILVEEIRHRCGHCDHLNAVFDSECCIPQKCSHCGAQHTEIPF